MRTARIVVAAVLIVACAPSSSIAQESGIKRTDLLRSDISVPGREVIQVLVEFAQGASFPKHSHPGEEIAYVVEGTIEYEIDGQAPVTLEAGESLFIPAGTMHAAKNAGGGKAAELATYIVDNGKPLLVLGQITR
jgi:quercetin dioxygenase-like cupin family protein